MSLIKRGNKGTALTHDELDGNFTHLGGDGSYVMPTTDGTSGQVMSTNGDGVVTFSTLTGVTATIANAYPVGSIYMNATNSTNPATLLGFGTWVSFGAGRVPVGINPSDTDFDTAEETGGAKNHTLTLSQIPSHTHTISGNISRSGFSFEHHQFNSRMPGENYDTNPTVSNAGGGQGHNNLQPYIVVYMWKRTA
jgi:hypothetical protein